MKKMRRKKTFIIIALILCISFVSGCWDHRELNELVIVYGWGIDLVNGSEIEVTAQCVTLSSMQGGKGNGGERKCRRLFCCIGDGKNTLDA
jgi:spore germination protein KC